MKQRGSKSRSSSHRGGGQERRERRREEIRSQLYPTTVEDQRGEPHLLYRRHHSRTSGIESSGPIYPGNGDYFHDYQNGFLEEPMNDRVSNPASFPQGAVSGSTPFHGMPASYTEQLKPLAAHSQGLERQPLIQPTKPTLSRAEEAGMVTKTCEAKDDVTAAEGKRDPPALEEKTDTVKQAEDSSVSHKKEAQSKPHSQPSMEKPSQERKEEVTKVENNGEKDEHTGPLDKEPTKPHPPGTKAETTVEEPTPSLPSKSDLNSEVESLASVLPSSEQILDPFVLPSSSSLPKLPPLKKSLPPLLPPIGVTPTTPAAANRSVNTTVQHETKSLESADKKEVKGVKEDPGDGRSSAGVAATHRGGIEGGGDSKREVKDEVSDKEKGGSSSAGLAATCTRGGDNDKAPGVGKGSPKEQAHDDAGQHSDQKRGGESGGGTTENQELETKDNSSGTTTKLDADTHSDRQQKQVESQESPQSKASPVKKEKGNKKEEVEDKRQTDHLDRVSGEGGDGGKGEKSGPGDMGEEEGKVAEGERKGKATVSPPTSVVTPPPRQPRNLKVH